MQVVDDDIETIHLYVVKEKEKKSYTVLPILAVFLCLAAIIGVTVYSALHPTHEHETLIIPAHFLPLQTFTTTQTINPTGIKTFPATTAHGILTLTNGSVITQELPQGMIFIGNGVEVITDSAVFIPAGSAINYGMATVEAKAISAGKLGNIQALTINQVYGTSLFIRNLHSFTGGNDAYTVSYITQQDKQTARDAARVSLAAQVARKQAILAEPCKESFSVVKSSLSVVNKVVKWTCQFVSYPNLPGMKVTGVTIQGKNLIVDVWFVVRPKPMQGNKR